MTVIAFSDVDVLDVLVVAAVAVTAILAIAIPRRVGATIAFLVFGLLLALLWARVAAPDVAIAEAALGGGVAGALLVDALHRRQPAQPKRDHRRAVAITAVGAALGAVTFAALATVLSRLTAEPADLGPLALEAVERSGVSHPITAVLLNFRNLDTLLEIAVVVFAAVGAAALSRDRIRTVTDPGPVRRVIAVIIVPALVLLAAWLLVAGTSEPGGAFQAGAVLGAALIIAHLCGVRAARAAGGRALVLVVAGLLAFILLGGIGLAATGTWLALDLSWAFAAILAIETLLTVSIGVALAMLFLAAGSRDDAAAADSAAAAPALGGAA